MSCSRTQHGGGRFRTPDLSLRSPTLYHWATALPQWKGKRPVFFFFFKRMDTLWPHKTLIYFATFLFIFFLKIWYCWQYHLGYGGSGGGGLGHPEAFFYIPPSTSPKQIPTPPPPHEYNRPAPPTPHLVINDSSLNSFFKRACTAIQRDYSVWLLVWLFVYFHTSCVRTAKALARLRQCAGSPEPSLVAYIYI